MMNRNKGMILGRQFAFSSNLGEQLVAPLQHLRRAWRGARAMALFKRPALKLQFWDKCTLVQANLKPLSH